MSYNTIKEKYNKFGLLSCYFSNGIRCTDHCSEWCPATDKIDDLYYKMQELNEAEEVINKLEQEIQCLKEEIHEIYCSMDK